MNIPTLSPRINLADVWHDSAGVGKVRKYRQRTMLEIDLGTVSTHRKYAVHVYATEPMATLVPGHMKTMKDAAKYFKERGLQLAVHVVRPKGRPSFIEGLRKLGIPMWEEEVREAARNGASSLHMLPEFSDEDLWRSLHGGLRSVCVGVASKQLQHSPETVFPIGEILRSTRGMGGPIHKSYLAACSLPLQALGVLEQPARRRGARCPNPEKVLKALLVPESFSLDSSANSQHLAAANDPREMPDRISRREAIIKACLRHNLSSLAMRDILEAAGETL